MTAQGFQSLSYEEAVELCPTAAVVRLFPAELAKELGCLPFERAGTTLRFVTVHATPELAARLRRLLGYEIELLEAPQGALITLVERHYISPEWQRRIDVRRDYFEHLIEQYGEDTYMAGRGIEFTKEWSRLVARPNCADQAVAALVDLLEDLDPNGLAGGTGWGVVIDDFLNWLLHRVRVDGWPDARFTEALARAFELRFSAERNPDGRALAQRWNQLAGSPDSAADLVESVTDHRRSGTIGWAFFETWIAQWYRQTRRETTI